MVDDGDLTGKPRMSGGKRNEREVNVLRATIERYRVTSGDGFDLARFASDDLPDEFPGKREAAAVLRKGVARMSVLQNLLYANATWSLLVVFQAMDAAGKDSTIKHVMTGINPQGVAVTSFKAPGPHELAHGFLWRVGRVVPARGMIGIFNRSHYEDVLVARVHEGLLEKSGLPPELIGANGFWERRIADIAAFEGYLGRQGTRVLKFFLNVGLDEQKKRFLSRLDDPGKTWKFETADLNERDRWPQYRAAYQAAIAGTATKDAPWFVVPADRKWFTRLVVAEAIVEALEDMNLKMPRVANGTESKLDDARERLENL